jgi:hypothetical protein
MGLNGTPQASLLSIRIFDGLAAGPELFGVHRGRTVGFSGIFQRASKKVITYGFYIYIIYKRMLFWLNAMAQDLPFGDPPPLAFEMLYSKRLVYNDFKQPVFT